jgi:hypothetical protein
MSTLSEMAALVSSGSRHQAVWRMTPLAWWMCCVIPIGGGKFLGDFLHHKKGDRELLGIHVEVFAGANPADCTIAIVHPNVRIEGSIHHFN